MLLPACRAGIHSGSWLRLMLNRPHYERIIAGLRGGERPPPPGAALAREGGIAYEVDPGPPLRVAFDPDGLLEVWTAIVFDPSGAVALADGFDPATGRFAAPDRVTRLFGGDLVRCRRLARDYYLCTFT
jgi:hypothetical protein